MPEILLPTSAKQDDILTRVTNIESQFPISGGFNPFDYSYISRSVSLATNINSMSEEVLFEMTGKGILNNLGLYLTSNWGSNHEFYIEVDGARELISGGGKNAIFVPGEPSPQAAASNITRSVLSLNTFIAFNSSLRLIFKNTANTSLAHGRIAVLGILI